MKTKIFSMYDKATDANGVDHIVTVVGKFEQIKEWNAKEIPVDVLYDEENNKSVNTIAAIPFKQTKRTLKIGYAICHPNDVFDKETGTRIATSRINHGEYVGELSTHNITMLNDDQCNLNVFGELMYITKNIDKYLPTEE